MGALAEEPFPDAESTNPTTRPTPTLRYLGDYELLEEVGRGGMGVVYRARQASLNRTVAVKLLLLGRFAGAQAEARFRHEAAAAARLRHPNVVPVFEVGEHDGQPFFSMEFVAGRDLDELVRAHPLAPDEAARLLERVARAVQHAHDQGVAHRDLKPSNVLVDEFGEPRVTDFGLAKLSDADPELTATGQVLGTPGFLAPEQAGRKPGGRTPHSAEAPSIARQDRFGMPGPSDARRSASDGGRQAPPFPNHDATTDAVSSGHDPRAADIYSLGAMLYHALTGRAPFAGASLAETLRQVAENEPPSPRLLNPDIPADLETITLKCLAKEPSRRYASAADLAEELARFRRGEPILARPVAPAERAWRWARRHPARAALALLVLALAAGGPLVAWRMNQLRLSSERFAEESRQRLVAAHVANGLRLAEANAVAEALPWFVEALALEAGRPECEEIHRLRLGTMLANAAPLRALWETDGPVRDLWFSADGSRLIAWLDNERGVPALRAWSPTNGAPLPLPPRPANAHDALAVSRDISGMILPATNGATLFRREGTNVVLRVLEFGSPAVAAAFSADAQNIALGTKSGGVRVFSAVTGQPQGPAWQVEDTVDGLTFDGRAGRLAVSHGGRFVQVRDLAFARSSRNLGRFHPVSAVAFCDSSDELLVTFRDGYADIWNALRTTRKFELRPDTELTAAAWTPQSRHVATAGRDGRVRVWHATTRSELVPALAHGTNLVRVVFSPDGNLLAAATADRLVQVWDLRAERRSPLPSARPPAAVRLGLKAVVGTDNSVRVVARGQVVSPPLRQPELSAARLAGDGRSVVTTAATGEELYWPVALETRPVAELRRLAELLSARRLDSSGELVPLSAAELKRRWALD